MSSNVTELRYLSQPKWPTELKRNANLKRKTAWLWHGYLAQRNVTLLTSQWKAGKTTLVSILLSQMQSGGEVAGRPVSPGKVIVLSEEDEDLWTQRADKFDFADHVCFISRPFLGKPTPKQWQGAVDELHWLHQRYGFNLLVIDTFAAFLPAASENDAGGVLAFLTSLQKLTAAGMAVLLLHHPSKDASPDGKSARGSGALPGFADIIMEMHWAARAADTDRRRKLLAWSRHAETPRRLFMELNEDATEYKEIPEPQTKRAGDDGSLNRTLSNIFAAAHDKLTLSQIRRDWPHLQPRPGKVTLWRWLEHAVATGQLRRTGAGRKKCPYLYWSPDRAESWRQNPEHAERLDVDDEWERIMAGLRLKGVANNQ